MQEAIEREFGTSMETWRPRGGIFLWMKLPDGVDVRTLIKPAADAGIVFNPGPEWAVDAEAAKSHLRLCFALPSKQVIKDGVARLPGCVTSRPVFRSRARISGMRGGDDPG